MLHVLHVSGVCVSEEKDIQCKSNGFELLPPLRRSPSLEEGGLWGGKSKVGRMSAENCNCEMCLQRWVASLQRSDVFATVGCTAVPRRGAHRAPVYPRCYNNPSSGRAKGHRGDRKAPISNRRQGRKALTGEAPDLPLRGRGTALRAVEGVRNPCVERRSRPPSSRKNLFQTSYASYASYARHISGI